MENDVLYNRIMNVVHEEYGEGSTAVANPEGEPTDSLEKIQIGDDVYSISGGGGASGMILTISESGEDRVLDKNYTEIKTAVESGSIPFAIVDEDGILTVCFYGFTEGVYGVVLYAALTQVMMTFVSNTDDGVLTLHH